MALAIVSKVVLGAAANRMRALEVAGLTSEWFLTCVFRSQLWNSAKTAKGFHTRKLEDQILGEKNDAYRHTVGQKEILA